MTTMLDKVAVAGDITKALDRRGVWTVAITVIGGTSGTAVKLQSSESASGTFTDFVELIDSSSASDSQYKGFVVDLHGAGKYIKLTGAKMATAVFGDCDYDVKDVTIVTGDIPNDVEAQKSITITENGTTTVSPSSGYEGIASVKVTVDVGATLYAYSYVDGEDTRLIYTIAEVSETGSITILTPETDTDYGYTLTEGTLTVADVNEDTFTDDSDNVYTRLTAKDIDLF